MMLDIHQDIKQKLNTYIENATVPHLIFHGPSGCGKRTIVNWFLKQIYNNHTQNMNDYIMYVDCAHGKGIKFIREQIKFFAKTNLSITKCTPFKSIVLSNADKLTTDAQSALRRLIEVFSHSTRFFVIVEDKYRILMQNWLNSHKKIVAADEPSFSLYYLNWLVNTYNLSLDFDFTLNDMRGNGHISAFDFTLSGDGSYHDLYRLILFLTENPLLYKIESFYLHRKKEDVNLLDFKMQIKGFSLTEKWQSEQEFTFDSIKPIAETVHFYDAFKPLYRKFEPKKASNMFQKKIQKPATKPKDDKLIDIEKTSLQAVANGRVYLKDKKGKLITLKIGDKVHLGSLTNINQKKSEVEFVLEEGGATKKVTLGLGYKK